MTAAMHTAVIFIHFFGADIHTATAKAKAALVCPDGKELGSCSGTRFTKFSITSQGRGLDTRGLMVKFTTINPMSMAHSAEMEALAARIVAEAHGALDETKQTL